MRICIYMYMYMYMCMYVHACSLDDATLAESEGDLWEMSAPKTLQAIVALTSGCDLLLWSNGATHLSAPSLVLLPRELRHKHAVIRLNMLIRQAVFLFGILMMSKSFVFDISAICPLSSRSRLQRKLIGWFGVVVYSHLIDRQLIYIQM